MTPRNHLENIDQSKLSQPSSNPKKSKTTELEKDIGLHLDPQLARVMLPWLLRHPRYLRAAYRLLRAVKHAKKARLRAFADGLTVPPFLILSITSSCNLRCSGCFAAAVGNIGHIPATSSTQPGQLRYNQWRSIIAEAAELGVMGFIIAGGEPFLFPGLLRLCAEFKDRFFLILTNGTAITQEDQKMLKRSSNIAVLVSIEGGHELTNARRGPGVYEQAFITLNRLTKLGIPNGISVTITRNNYNYWMDPKNIDNLIDHGIHLGSFIEYIPTTPNHDNEPLPINADHLDATDNLTFVQVSNNNASAITNDHQLVLTPEQRAKFREQVLSYREEKPIYLIHSPGDEEFFGGCVSAGRGFAHVTPTGDLTPCPISNIATHNLVTSSLRAGLASPLFKEIRDSDHLLENDDSPCALFAHEKEVNSLAEAVGAYRTGIKNDYNNI